MTDCQIREAACDGAYSMRELSPRLGVATQCGRCARHARPVLEETLRADSLKENDKAA